MKVGLICAAALAAQIGISASASATIVETVYTGTIVDGVDVTGVFGSPNSSLSGEQYTATYIYDTTLGYIDGNYPSGEGHALGGPSFTPPSPAAGYPSPIIFAAMTIDGRSVIFSGDYYGVVTALASAQQRTASEQDYRTGDIFVCAWLGNSISSANDNIPGNAIGPFTYTAESADIANGSFVFQVVDRGTNETLDYAYANEIVPSSVTVSPIPEPSTWAMMLLGFAGLGYAWLRARGRFRLAQRAA
jgi:hypothetical protein